MSRSGRLNLLISKTILLLVLLQTEATVLYVLQSLCQYLQSTTVQVCDVMDDKLHLGDSLEQQ